MTVAALVAAVVVGVLVAFGVWFERDFRRVDN